MPETTHSNTRAQHIRRMLAHAKKIKERSLVLLICNTPKPILDNPTLQKHYPHSSSQDILIQNIPENCNVISVFFPHNTASKQFLSPTTHYKQILQNSNISTALTKAIAQYPKNCCVIYTDSSLYKQKHIVDPLLSYLQNEIMQQWKNHSTALVLGSRWIKNIWHNLAMPTNYLSFGVPLIQGNALVLGAGPSLDASLLKTIITQRKKIILLSCDTALPTLQHHGITPDICIILESQYYNIKDFLPPPKAITYALSDITAFPPSHKVFTHNNFFFTKFAPLSFFSRLQKKIFTQNNTTTSTAYKIPALGSVGINAVYHALKSKASSITLAGLDFGFYKGKSHCIHSPPYNSYLSSCSRTHTWDSAVSHFLDSNTYPLTSPQTNKIYQPAKYSNTSLTMYAHSLDSLLSQNENNTSATPFYEVQNTSSALHCTRIINAKQYNTFLNKAQNAQLSWNTKKIKPAVLQHFLHQEYTLANKSIQLLKKLSYKKEIPTKQQWKQGIDFYAYGLPDDLQLLLHNKDYWQKYDIYEKITHKALKIAHDISQVLKNKI